MADSVLTEVYRRPIKIPKWHRTCEGSKSASKKRELKVGDVEDDEYLRQYLLFHYQFHISEGFNVDWDQFDYVFSVRPLDNSPPISDTRTNAEVIRDVTLLAIEKHNEAHGTKLVFVEHVAANYQFTSGLRCWLTFWATDMASFPPESKIYQAHVWRRGTLFKTYMFRLKPKDEEIDSVEVEPPSPMPYDDYEETIGNVKILAYRLGKDKALVEHRMNKPPVAFARVDPKDGALPGVPFIFDRTGALLVRDRFGRW